VSLRVDTVSVSYEGVAALEDVSLDVADGERLAVLGPSGSGKSTLLRVIAGLQPPDRGAIVLGRRDVTGVPPHLRGVGMTFQEGVLFPHRDVAGNVGFGLQMAGVPASARRRNVADVLALVGLSGYERRSVGTLSGGERQRVALARALAPEPEVLLLDEPLGSLDGPLRERLLEDLELLFERLGLTVVLVTHDVGEAFALGDRVALLRQGRLVQCAPPDELWARPAEAWVAQFLGMANVRKDGDGTTVIRPEAVVVRPGRGATVVSAERRGPLVRLRVRLETGEELDAVTTQLDHPQPGDNVAVEIDPAGVLTWGNPGFPHEPPSSAPSTEHSNLGSRRAKPGSAGDR
jgi:thiamine transport system ATP-binding protein